MKKILLLVYLCIFLLLACSGGFSIGVPPFFNPSPVHCTQSGPIRTVRVQQVTVDFYCGITSSQQALIVEFVGHALDAMPPGVLPHAEVFAFTNLDEGIAAEDQLMKSEGYWPAVENLRNTWLDRGLLGQSFKGAAFLYVGNPSWEQDSPALAALTILHEMHHVFQYELIDSSRHAPLWLLEGGADDFAALEMVALDLRAPSRTGVGYHCDYRLAELEYERDSVPLACAYLEGARAVQILLDEFGRRSYYQLLRNIGTSSSFDGAFVETYGLKLSDFSQRFGAYRKSGYTVRPGFAIPTGTPFPIP